MLVKLQSKLEYPLDANFMAFYFYIIPYTICVGMKYHLLGAITLYVKWSISFWSPLTDIKIDDKTSDKYLHLGSNQWVLSVTIIHSWLDMEYFITIAL